MTAPTSPTDRPAMDLLRFATAGSVDDGKSTLIGRLLLDSKGIFEDQLESVEATSKSRGYDYTDLALLTDGLRSEREQGITIDVAYRYFATRKRKFIIADAPGHEQYTRNMVTAAAGSDAAVVLVDITKLDLRTRPVALLPQTRRHTLLAQLLRVPGIVFAINKLDAVDDPAAAYVAVRDALETFAQQAGIEVAGIVPVSALRGDNVTRPLDVAWYRRPSLLQLLESLPAASEPASDALSMPVQYVARQARDDTAAADGGIGDQRRTIWGRIASGRVAPGDAVEVFPSGERAVVADVLLAGGAVDDAAAGQSVGLMLDRQLDVSRGDWITTPRSTRPTQRFEATLAWLDTEPAVVGRRYQVRHGNRWVQARIAAIESRLDIRTLASTSADSLAVNEIGKVVVETQQPLPLAPYSSNRVAGALIVVDPTTHRTSGALLVSD